MATAKRKQEERAEEYDDEEDYDEVDYSPSSECDATGSDATGSDATGSDAGIGSSIRNRTMEGLFSDLYSSVAFVKQKEILNLF